MGTYPPKFSDCFIETPKVRTGEKERPIACSSCRSMSLYVCGCCQTAAIPTPRLPNHQDVVTQHLVLGSEAYVRDPSASRNIAVIIAMHKVHVLSKTCGVLCRRNRLSIDRFFRNAGIGPDTRSCVHHLLTVCEQVIHRLLAGTFPTPLPAARPGPAFGCKKRPKIVPRSGFSSALKALAGFTDRVPCEHSGSLPVVSHRDAT